MKYVFLILIMLFISGCNSEITKYEIDFAEDVCKDRGGIYTIETFFIRPLIVCNDGYKKIMSIQNERASIIRT